MVKDKTNIYLDKDYADLKNILEQYIESKRDKGTETVYTASTYLKWLQEKTRLISNESSFSIPEGVTLKRTNVVWIDFGFNIGQEFGGKHPAIILRISGEQVFVMPLSSQAPDPSDQKKPMYVKVPIVYDFPPMTRWLNVLNMKSVSMVRIDFNSNIGRVSGKIMDKISESLALCGIN
jgi:mRNA-degrading endonuclease toxin of MazEF toxin-antitoxin module